MATVLILIALLVALVVGIAPNVDTRVVELGEGMWPGYAAELRSDPVAPDCDVAELDERLEACPADAQAPAGNGEGAEADDPFGGEDPFADPAPAPAPADDDPFGGEDPFADPAPAPAPTADDPFGGEDPFAAPAAAPTPVNCPALRNLADSCASDHAAYAAAVERLTPTVKAFRGFELFISRVAQFPFGKHMLVLLVILGALSTTAHRMHIALRNPQSLLEHRVRQAGLLVAHLLWLVSCVADYQVQIESAAERQNLGLPVLWALGFAALAVINLVHLARPPKDLDEQPTSVVRLLMIVPLYVYMGIIGGIYFTFVEQHASGQAIYLHKFVQHPTIYLGIGLYIWAGMMLSRTRLATLGFDVLLPFQLPPALLAWLVVVLAAFPTAYSGASGIFVIAAGAVIFERLTAVGATPRVALAATAMSGSLGVVLRPCLVVVLIAVLNKQVTTDELFSYGLQVFALTALLSLVAFVLWNRDPLKFPDLGKAVPESLSAMRPLLPYLAIGVGVLLFYGVAFKTTVNEHTAPMVLPAVLLALLAWDRTRGTDDGPTLVPALVGSTSETSHHTGALLMVMCGSVGLGGVVERAEIMALVPESFGSLWITMTVLVVVMVLVGMTMDALGAVVLVSVTVAKIAYDNGIDPTHFWMVVLVGFELGYLTPPVSLNHLLARQVIGEASDVAVVDPKEGFFAQYEHLIVPMAIMGTALVIVAYGPLFFY
ncbi:MAG: TRAP transporter large permease subunit [Myxococcales bacterium]|nr:TRAP transporter large permease subunit [Myxococcales bacterium]